MRLKGEIAMVTGAGRGIGAETARVLARHGAAVAVTARKRVYADTIAAEITASGGRALALSCDVTDAGSIEAAMAVAARELGAPTILVNNAGIIAPLGPLHETSPTEWAANVVVNLVGVANAARAVLPAMLAARRGTIVNLSSGAAHIPIAGWSAYCAAKAGLAMLTRTLATEYAEHGIRVFGFAPGLVDTAMQEAIRASGIGPVAKLPREKLRNPRDPAEAIAFLCSPRGDSFAGQEIDIRNADFRAACGLAPLAA